LWDGKSKAGAKLTGREKIALGFEPPLLRVQEQELKKEQG
jgi:hypothetical protein